MAGAVDVRIVAVFRLVLNVRSIDSDSSLLLFGGIINSFIILSTVFKISEQSKGGGAIRPLGSNVKGKKHKSDFVKSRFFEIKRGIIPLNLLTRSIFRLLL